MRSFKRHQSCLKYEKIFATCTVVRSFMSSFDIMETTVRKHVVNKIVDSIGLEKILAVRHLN